MYLLIQNEQIVGTTDNPRNEIAGFEIVEGPDLPIELLYFDGSRIQVKPEPPSELHFWQNNQWRLPEPSVAVRENWDGLVIALRGSSFWGKVYTAAGRTLKANVAWTLLYGTLTKTHNLQDLNFAIVEIREAMRGITGIGDFTTEEITALNQLLDDNGFTLRLE